MMAAISNSNPEKKRALRAVGIGILYMIVALVAQTFIQSIPEIALLAERGFSISGFSTEYLKAELDNAILFSVYMGGIAGIAQEVSEYVAVDTMEREYAIHIGFGFAVIDIIILVAEAFIGRANFTAFGFLLIIFNVISPFLLHPGTATMMKWGRIIGKGALMLSISIILHAGIDGGLVYTDLYVIQNPASYHLVAAIYWLLVLVFSAAVFVIGLRLIGRVREVSASEKPVVY
ncbi:MAG: hypothetical protein QW812_03245 [Thermoplasmataceae archaeon]